MARIARFQFSLFGLLVFMAAAALIAWMLRQGGGWFAFASFFGFSLVGGLLGKHDLSRAALLGGIGGIIGLAVPIAIAQTKFSDEPFIELVVFWFPVAMGTACSAPFGFAGGATIGAYVGLISLGDSVEHLPIPSADQIIASVDPPRHSSRD